MNANFPAPARLPMLAAMLSGALVLANCQTSGPATTSGACAVWQPISSSVNDTEQTRVEIVASNAARRAYCHER